MPGYWDWDPARNAFIWIGGTWQIPPGRSSWIAGRWMRDADGWYRVPGYWSGRGDRAVAVARINTPAWRTSGPPADHPDDNPGAAPGPDFFFVPGYYNPTGDRLSWVSGFWARLQPGWDWVPARWVRRSDGWDFRAGYWVRDPALVDNNIKPGRRVVPPAPLGPSPTISDSLPDPSLPGTVVDRLAPPDEEGRDPIAESERAGRLPVGPPVAVDPITGMRYYVLRPPGSYPYGPGGVVVPGAVPPFVRRFLDRVLP
jgi:WXXGXW repeat (2 copies)